MVLLFKALVCLFVFCNGFIDAAHSESLTRRYDEGEIQVDDRKHDIEFFTFVTRPDIDAPRWDINFEKDSELLAPGFWFVAPYGKVIQTHDDKAYVAPHIYDNNGDLVWSGAPLLKNKNTFAFKVSNVGGKDMLTAIYPEAGHGLLINDAYEIHDTVDVGEPLTTTNMHEFQTVDNGTRALYLTKERTTTVANAERVGFEDGPCEIAWNGFEERDIESGEVTFSWSSRDHIRLDESVMYKDDPAEICENGSRDYVHLNSVEKLPDGEYIISGRRTDTLYKISRDGSIAWRLGGKNNDFDLDGHFSGQHDIRCLEQNSTHLILTVLDNAIGPGWPKQTNGMSRGLVLSVNTEEMTAKTVKTYDHPHHDHAFERGNFQTLPNGNALVFWTHNGLNSEYTPEGDVIQWSRMRSGLKTYRGYKYEWVGRPKTPPDVHSQAVIVEKATVTIVHVSWNGATEVDAWNVYETAKDGSDKELVVSAHRKGFESAILVDGYIQNVVVEGVDREGNKLGESEIFETLDCATGNFVDPQLCDVLNRWHDDGPLYWYEELYLFTQDPLFAFVGGVLFCVAAGLSAWGVLVACRRYSRRGEKTAYVALAASEEEEELKVLDNKVSDDYDPRQVER